jgi:hypothetical protein
LDIEEQDIYCGFLTWHDEIRHRAIYLHHFLEGVDSRALDLSAEERVEHLCGFKGKVERVRGRGGERIDEGRGSESWKQ